MQIGQQWESLDPLMQISTLSSVSALQALSNNAQCCKPATLERMKIGEQGETQPLNFSGNVQEKLN